jgi:Ca-activated chloride channel family protein
MNFAEPRLLALALLAPVAAAVAAWLWRRRLAADAAWASRGLWDRLLPAYTPRRLALSVATLALAILGASLALARPRWGGGEQQVERRGVDVVFLVDSSLSMGAADVPPSRLFVAKTLVRRMAREMPGNRLGLVQTEGSGVVLAPLTLDGAVLDLLLDTIDPGSLPNPGTELASGLETALRLFGEGSGKHRTLVVLSDGEDHGGGVGEITARLKEEGVVVHAFGVGTPDGAPVPVPGGGGAVKRHADGSAVLSQLHEDVLEGLARASGGSYLRVTSAAVDPAPTLRQIERMEKRTIENESVSTQEERFQWPLALAALALLLHLARPPFAPAPHEQERGRKAVRGQVAQARAHIFPLVLLAAWAVLPSLPWQPHLPAWAERWLYNPRERTERAIEAHGQGEPGEAVGPADTALRLAPEDPLAGFNAGTVHLAAGHERRAAKLLEEAARRAGPGLSPAVHYNLGNARFAAGDPAGAVEAYKQALREEPGNLDTKFNLELALQEREKQRQGMRGGRQGSRGNRPDRQDPSPGRGQGQPNDEERQRRDARDPGQQQQDGQQQSQGRSGDARRPAPRDEGPLSRFRNQPEMSAREAAAVLAAVENLERQQRRGEAAKRARQRSVQGKDW